jgi:hypothetical protein
MTDLNRIAGKRPELRPGFCKIRSVFQLRRVNTVQPGRFFGYGFSRIDELPKTRTVDAPIGNPNRADLDDPRLTRIQCGGLGIDYYRLK